MFQDEDLENAITSNNLEEVRKILNSGSNLDLEDALYTAIRTASRDWDIDEESNAQIIRELVRAGADLNNKKVWHTFNELIDNQDIEMVDLLIDLGLNEKGIQHLVRLSVEQEYAIPDIQEHMKKYLRPQNKNDDLLYALLVSNDNYARYLLTINDYDADNLYHILYQSFDHESSIPLATLRFLLKYRSYTPEQLLSLLMSAPRKYHISYMITLLEEVKYTQEQLYTALESFILNNYVGIDEVNQFVKHGFDINYNAAGLLSAVINGGNSEQRTLQYLIDKGINLHADNDLALAIALKEGYRDLVNLLTKHNASTYARAGIGSVY